MNENEKQQQQNAVREDSETEHKKAESETPVTVAPFNEASLIDISKLACLLCKRRFDSLDILNKHIVKSDLHKVIYFLILLMIFIVKKILKYNF